MYLTLTTGGAYGYLPVQIGKGDDAGMQGEGEGGFWRGVVVVFGE